MTEVVHELRHRTIADGLKALIRPKFKSSAAGDTRQGQFGFGGASPYQCGPRPKLRSRFKGLGFSLGVKGLGFSLEFKGLGFSLGFRVF